MVAAVLIAAVAIAAAACAHSSAGPGRVPPREDLLHFLNTSPSVQAIADAAQQEGLLSSREEGLEDIEDLEAAARSLGIESIRSLSRHVDRVVEGKDCWGRRSRSNSHDRMVLGGA